MLRSAKARARTVAAPLVFAGLAMGCASSQTEARPAPLEVPPGHEDGVSAPLPADGPRCEVLSMEGEDLVIGCFFDLESEAEGMPLLDRRAPEILAVEKPIVISGLCEPRIDQERLARSYVRRLEAAEVLAREGYLKLAAQAADEVLEGLRWVEAPGSRDLVARARRLSLVKLGAESLWRRGKAAFDAFRFREAAMLLSAAVTANRRDARARDLWRKCLFVLDED